MPPVCTRPELDSSIRSIRGPIVFWSCISPGRAITRFRESSPHPYLFISAPIIILSVILFPVVHSLWFLVVLWLLQMLFTDIKAATIPLLNIDCMPRRMLARTAAPAGILTALVTFLRASGRHGPDGDCRMASLCPFPLEFLSQPP